MASNEQPFRIGFFGGSFDPLHNGHLMLIEEALQSGKLDTLLLCPAFHAPLRSEKPLFSGEQRLEMVRSVCSERSELETFDHEIQQARTCYTYETLLEVRKIYPDAQIHLLIGNDQFQKLDQWRFNRELLQIAHLLVFSRDQNEVVPPSGIDPLPHTVMHNPLVPVSSTEVRHHLLTGQSVSELVPPVIHEILKTMTFEQNPSL
ncbi:MAG: nicotinate (nicotinamide) nucleotide adenylyltransferase [Opitutales bacterium]